MRFYFLLDQVNTDILEFEFSKVGMQLADMLIKQLKKEIFDEMKNFIRMERLSNLN